MEVPRPPRNVTERARCCLILFNREVQFNLGCHVPPVMGVCVAAPQQCLASDVGSKLDYLIYADVRYSD